MLTDGNLKTVAILARTSNAPYLDKGIVIQLLQHIREQEAQLAAYRDALERIAYTSSNPGLNGNELTHAERWLEKAVWAREALVATDAGQSLLDRLQKLVALCRRAGAIMGFHAERCPLDPAHNYSGSEEHLAEYSQVQKDIIAALATPHIGDADLDSGNLVTVVSRPPGLWQTGRMDMRTYDALTGEPCTYVYRPGDDEHTRICVRGENCDTDALQIATAVNACEGMPVATLTAGSVKAVADPARAWLALRTQRHALWLNHEDDQVSKLDQEIAKAADELAIVLAKITDNGVAVNPPTVPEAADSAVPQRLREQVEHAFRSAGINMLGWSWVLSPRVVEISRVHNEHFAPALAALKNAGFRDVLPVPEQGRIYIRWEPGR